MERIEVDQTDDKTFHAKFTPRVKGGEKLLEVENLAIGYDHVLTTISMKMRRGDRIAIIGPNGTGNQRL